MRSLRALSAILLTGLVASSAISCKSSKAGERSVAPPGTSEGRRMPAPEYLPEAARAALWERMQGHGNDMTLLLWAVLFLDYENAGRIAGTIVSEPKLARPVSPEDDTLNNLLPDNFFKLQDELDKKARKMVELAAKPERDPAEFAHAYGDLAETCVRCHAVYLYEKPSPEDAAGERP